MQKVTVKEFKAKFSHYLQRMSEGEAFEVKGTTIGKVDHFGISIKNTEPNKKLEILSPNKAQEIIDNHKTLKIYPSGSNDTFKNMSQLRRQKIKPVKKKKK